ncbi:MAG: YcjF family protein [Cyanobium sp.]
MKALPGLARPALLTVAGLVATDGLAHLLHPGSGLVVGLGAVAGSWLLLGGGRRPSFAQPTDLQGWIERCEGLLPQFERFGVAGQELQERQAELGRLGDERQRSEIQLAVTGVEGAGETLHSGLATALQGSRPIQIHLGHPLSGGSEGWRWPEGLAAADGLVFRLTPPLRASELRWLEALPEGQPVWLLLHPLEPESLPALRHELAQQWPALDPDRLLSWDGQSASLPQSLAPLTDWLHRQGSLLRSRTARRRLVQLHLRWQAELELKRRREWQRQLLRTQWLVAGGVLVSPLPSLDLLVLATANGLMLREMAQLWECPWSLEQLRAAATELARAALAQGVIEWTSQALASAIKVHGATWLVGGSLQALSAAYLTRVVGHAMADLLALSSGLSEPDLARIQREAPLLVARAAQEERLDWGEFLRQARGWWDQQPREAGLWSKA